MSYDVDLNSGEDGKPSTPVSEDQDYELVYGTGGHGGPHHGYTAAAEAARRHLDGSKTETIVYIVPRTAPHYTYRHAVRCVRKSR